MSISEIQDWATALVALRDTANESRGFVAYEEDPTAPKYPCTTGEDVIAIAALFDPIARVTLPSDSDAMSAWIVAVADMTRDALMQPFREYENNAQFWAALEQVCVELDQSGADLWQLELWDALLAHLAAPTNYRNVGPKGDGPFKHFEGVKTFDDLYNAQAKYLRELRGFDRLEPEPNGTGGVRSIPRTTNADVIQLADYWSKQLASARHVMGHEGVEKRWSAAIADVSAIARKGNPDALYPKNNAFWRALQATAIQVAVADEAPTPWDIAMAAIKHSVKNLPENLASGAKAATNAIGDVAEGAGRIVNKAASGLFGGFGKPLLIGAGVVGLGLIAFNRSGKAAS